MIKIDKSAPVMVTGATGYVAGCVVKRLLDQGHVVHAAVRDPDNKEKLKYLDAVAAEAQGELRYFESHLPRAPTPRRSPRLEARQVPQVRVARRRRR